VWLVRGDRLSAASDLVPSLAESMHVRDVPGSSLLEAVAEHLQMDSTVVVLDNLEHLPGAARVVMELVSAASSVRVLATSRAPLRLALERRIVVEPLTDDDAAELFGELAREVDPGISLDDRSAIEAVCGVVGGLPLALELAAARLRVLTPAQLAARLSAMTELHSGTADLPERQRSFRATVEWSLGLVSSSARQLFASMGVFAGPVALEVVEAVCQDDIDLLESAAELLDFALLRRVESGLELLPALREIAREQLEDSGRGPEVRRSHIECLIGIGEETKGPSADQAASARREALLAETWHAAAWARAAQPYLHLLLTRLYAADWGFVQGRVREALAESARALSSAELLATNNERAELMFVHALVLSWCARTDEALQLAELAAELVEDRTPLKAGDDLIMLSMIRGAAGANQGAIDAAREAVALARQAGGPGRLLRNLAYLAQALTAAVTPTRPVHCSTKPRCSRQPPIRIWQRRCRTCARIGRWREAIRARRWRDTEPT
jgi:predicted ATPase